MEVIIYGMYGMLMLIFLRLGSIKDVLEEIAEQMKESEENE